MLAQKVKRGSRSVVKIIKSNKEDKNFHSHSLYQEVEYSGKDI